MTRASRSTGDVVAAYVKAHNRHDLSALAGLYRPGGRHVEVATGNGRTGGEEIAAGLATFLKAFPDAVWTAEVPVVSGSRAAVPYVLRGSLQAALGPFEPSGQVLDLAGVWIVDVDGDGISLSSDYWDAATFGRQMAGKRT